MFNHDLILPPAPGPHKWHRPEGETPRGRPGWSDGGIPDMPMITGWRPDWAGMINSAPLLEVEPAGGYAYLVADSHLGDARAPVEEFVDMLDHLPEARLVVFLGDLFKVWLALPKFWERQAHALLAGFERLRSRGVPVWFVVGNREYFLPRHSSVARSRGLPFDRIIHEAAVMGWGGRRYGLTHGDLVNREDSQYLKWRRFSRSRPFEALFRALPGPLARRVAAGIERSLANTNQEVKISFPLGELEAFAAQAMAGLDGFFIGHFHRDQTFAAPGGRAILRIVPDWFSTRQLLRLDEGGGMEILRYGGGGLYPANQGGQQGAGRKNRPAPMA